jgi:hypothetical protein
MKKRSATFAVLGLALLPSTAKVAERFFMGEV